MGKRTIGRLVALAWLTACGAGGNAPLGYLDGGFGARGDAGLGPPPEMEVEIRFEPPAVGATVLYATNTAAGRVAVIHATDFSIETVGVGVDPLPAVAAPGRDLALSLDRGSSTVSLLRTTDAGTSVTALHVDHDANAVAFDPTGTFAVIFEGPRPGVVRRNLQELSVVRLVEGSEHVVRVVVGYGPSRVQFDPAGARAFVVTEDGISLIDLVALPPDGPVRAPLLGFGTSEPIGETQITPDGTYALARFGSAALRQLDLRDGTVVTADLAQLAPGEVVDVTDVDIAPSGTEVLAVARSHEGVVRLPIGAALADPASWALLDLTGEPVGSLVFSPDGNRFVSYTTDPLVEAIAIVDLDVGQIRHVTLRKSVRALAIAPDGRFALALHHAVVRAGAPSPPDEATLVDRAQGYSLVDLETAFVRLALVDAEPQPDAVVLDPTSGHLFVALRDDARAIRQLDAVDLLTFAVDTVPLLAPPTTVGVFPALDRAFVGQEADGGRVTFYLWGTRETHTVAGFELAARIRR